MIHERANQRIYSYARSCDYFLAEAAINQSNVIQVRLELHNS